MNKFKFWYYWLIVVSWIIIGFGLSLVTISQSPYFDILNKPVLQIFNISPESYGTKKIIIWLYSILGATMAGWGMCIYLMLKHAFVKKEKWTWIALLISMIIWFIPDTIISVLYGAYFNVIINTLILFIIALPLSFVYQDFFHAENK
jgi:hypothetical protein